MQVIVTRSPPSTRKVRRVCDPHQQVKELDALDAQLRQVYRGLPESTRNVVTTPRRLRYLAAPTGCTLPVL